MPINCVRAEVNAVSGTAIFLKDAKQPSICLTFEIAA